MPNRIRVLLVIAGLPAGGAERQLALLARYMDRRQFEVGLLIFNAAAKVHYRDVLSKDIWFRALELSHGDGIRLLPRLIRGTRRAIADYSPNVVHASLNVANHTVRLSRIVCRWRAPIITNVRNDFRAGYTWRERLAERLLWRQSAFIVCNAAAAREQMVAELAIPNERIGVVPNGIDPDFLADDPGPLPDWWPTSRVALVLGRFSVQKNHLGLINALSQTTQNGLFDDWKFVFVGEGPLEGEIRRAIIEKGLSEFVSVHPRVADPRPLYHAARLVVLPSLFEGVPNTALEAQASGCPVAITEAANGAGTVAPDQGFILKGDLASALPSVLRVSDSVLDGRGNEARTRVIAEFGVEAMLKRTEEILFRVAGAHKSEGLRT